MIISIKPKGYKKKDFEVEYLTHSSKNDKGITFMVWNSSGISKIGLLIGNFIEGVNPRINLVEGYWEAYSEAEFFPYLSPLYEEIKKHCTTWLESPSPEPFPWETEEEFKRNQ